jgi:hypothetical protein
MHPPINGQSFQKINIDHPLQQSDAEISEGGGVRKEIFKENSNLFLYEIPGGDGCHVTVALCQYVYFLEVHNI